MTASGEKRSPTRLSDFIRERQDTILSEWVKFAGSLLPWAKGMSLRGLKDHAEELLHAVVDDMQSPQSTSEKSEKSKGRAKEGALGRVGQKHANERLESGLNLEQLVSEYRALRASVLRLWEEARGDKQGEVTRFNEAIDETLAESAARYTESVHNTREQFLAILGHDLRNPLTSIIMGATQLTRPETTGETQVRVAARILSSARRMDRMVNDLLDLTRTRLGSGIPILPRPMDLAPVCQSVVAELEGAHPACRFQLETHGDLRGTWDGDRLAQVLSNLVANAVQHGSAAGVIGVEARDLGSKVSLRVHNLGDVIPDEALARIFDPMVRRASTQPGGDRNASGLGLGLYIAHEIVSGHGGAIAVTSSSEEGTAFTVTLPRTTRLHEEPAA